MKEELSDVEYEIQQSIERMQKAYEKAAVLPPGIRTLIWREINRMENVLWWVKRRANAPSLVA